MRQYSWLQNDLAGVDRSLTPWVVVYGHRPMYCTNSDRDDCTAYETRTRTGLPLLKWWPLEPLLAQHGVDLAGERREEGEGGLTNPLNISSLGSRAQLRETAANLQQEGGPQP